MLDFEQLSAYLDDELNATERSALEARLQTDGDLQSELESLRQTVALLKQMPLLKAPRNYTLDPARFAQTRRPLAFPSWRVFVPALAAVLVVMIAGVLFLNAGSQKESSDSQAVAVNREATSNTHTAPTFEVALAATPTAIPSTQPTASPSPQPTTRQDDFAAPTAAAFSPQPTMTQEVVLESAGASAPAQPDGLSLPSGAGGDAPQDQAGLIEGETDGALPAAQSNAVDGASASESPAEVLPPAAAAVQPTSSNEPVTGQAAADEIAQAEEKLGLTTLLVQIDQLVRIIFALLRAFP